MQLEKGAVYATSDKPSTLCRLVPTVSRTRTNPGFVPTKLTLLVEVVTIGGNTNNYVNKISYSGCWKTLVDPVLLITEGYN